MLSCTDAAARLHLKPAEFSELRRTYPLPSIEGKGGPHFDPLSLDQWFAGLPFCIRQAHPEDQEHAYLMRLWGYLRQIAPPLGDPRPRLIMKGNHFTLFDRRGETRFNSLAQAIDGLKLALRLARTRSVVVLKAAA